jgi:hypothetical protein
VEVVSNVFYLDDPDRRRQSVIQNDLEVLNRYRRARLEGNHLTKGMHSRIGPTRTLWQYLFACRPSNNFGQNSLNGRKIGLDLPSMEVRAVVRNRQFEVSLQAHADRFWCLG